jgi:hypothetical protein
VIAWRWIVDPAPNPKKVEEGRPHTAFAIATSDAFFERRENRVRAQGSQLALIDGDHSFAKALHDFENLEALAASNSIIAIHDVVPDDMDARRATSKAETAFHTDRRTASGGSRIRTSNAAARRPFIGFMLHCMSPLLAQSGHSSALNQCLLLGVKRTSDFVRV